jgi:hypothetical protein
MRKMQLLQILVLLTLFTSIVFATCEIPSAAVKKTSITYKINESTVDLTMLIWVDYSLELEKCIISESNPDVNTEQVLLLKDTTFECPKYLYDKFKQTGDFSETNCLGSFIGEKNLFKFGFVGTEKEIIQINDSNITTKFGGSNLEYFIPLEREASFISIILPENAKQVTISPKNITQSKDKIVPYQQYGVVSYEPIPEQPIIISYTLIQDQTSIILITGLILLVIVITVASIWTIRKLTIQKIDKKARITEIKEKIKNLEQAYMMRKIDETTYRRLFEQYQLQLNEAITDVKKEEVKKPLSSQPQNQPPIQGKQ